MISGSFNRTFKKSHSKGKQLSFVELRQNNCSAMPSMSTFKEFEVEFAWHAFKEVKDLKCFNTCSVLLISLNGEDKLVAM